MSVGNYGGIKTQLEQYIASSFSTRNVHGLALLPYLVDRVLTRPDFANTLNAKVKLGQVNVNSGTTDTAITDSAANLIACIIDNSQASTDGWVAFFNTATASVNTTSTAIQLSLKALQNTVSVYLFPDPVVFSTAMNWTAFTTGKGTTVSTAGVITLSVIYTA